MHELSLCEGILQFLEDQASEQDYARVKTVWLEIGAVYRTAANRRELAEAMLSRLLGNAERGQSARPAANIARLASTNTAHVESESCLALAGFVHLTHKDVGNAWDCRSNPC